MTDDHKAEAVTRAIYDTDPWFDNGERLLTFDEAKPRGLIRNSEVAASAILARFNVTERDEDTSRYRAVNLATGQRTPSWEPGERAQISDWTLWREERFNSATSEWEVFDE